MIAYWDTPVNSETVENYVEPEEGECVGTRFDFKTGQIFNRFYTNGKIVEIESK